MEFCVSGLGTQAGRSVQHEFDGAVACLRLLLDQHVATQARLATSELCLTNLLAAAASAGYAAAAADLVARSRSGKATAPTADVTSAAAAVEPASMDSGSTPKSKTKRTPGGGGSGAAAVAGGGASSASAAAPAVVDAGVEEGAGAVPQEWADLVANLGPQVQRWEAIVRTHQNPSRVLKWAAN